MIEEQSWIDMLLVMRNTKRYSSESKREMKKAELYDENLHLATCAAKSSGRIATPLPKSANGSDG